jgi:hypothetical protein
MLSEHKESEIVAGFMKRLDLIKQEFDNIDVAFTVDFDPNTEEGQELIDKAIQQIESLQSEVEGFRGDLID